MVQILEYTLQTLQEKLLWFYFHGACYSTTPLFVNFTAAGWSVYGL